MIVENFRAGLVPTYPVWPLTDPQYVKTALEEHLPADQVETALNQAVAHDEHLVKAQTGAFGSLFIPDLSAGVVEGVGYATLVDSPKDIDIDKTLRKIRVFNPGPGAKALSNTTGRLPDSRHGPAAMHLIEYAVGRDKLFVGRFDYWVFAEPRQAIKISTTYWDPARFELLVDAVAEFVIRMEPVG